MKLRRLASRFFAIFVIVGLVWHPLMTQAVAKQLPMSSARMTSVSAMSVDMACCQSEKQNNNGCKECPLAMCTLIFAQPERTSADGIQISLRPGRLFIAPDDLIADGLIGDPPDHPPRT
ncbi:MULTISPECIES: hypothetical protein [Rhodopseudomonas]|uniref:DUF2946 domain-containing protein n=1 Tax=Rhodopseudomonas palustris TaxID=1076 RepID=A0A0D7EHD4_RHOPL|nr:MULTISPECIES: hypothetical protein [Rhodopseudomonas]KIZ40086.1 hypothetical protein OO17_18665 [Rhodopseudomonas palustris]MBN8936558.1 hypothetical protein [Hyphomicrobiales bacterium]MDF3812019.1 hypothetical protein [Rhodopseudomonas sp. BAL398]WOK21085.1 hypothetical protein RBJ75_29325 [Rhodopseudomonas sp. BAL398]